MKYQLKVTSEPIIKALLGVAAQNNVKICGEYQRNWKHYPYLVMYVDSQLGKDISGNSWERSDLISVTLEEMFELLASDSISKMKLNDEYTAEVNYSLRVVNVGC